jgi:glycosyltransferase involved in cell wall biosynthesis
MADLTTDSSEHNVALVFVGAIVPERPAFLTTAFSRAGQIYQRELLQGLLRAGIQVSEIVSIMPTPSYAKSDRLWVSGSKEEIIKGVETKLVPFLNVTPVKQIMVGVGTTLELLRWGWRNKRVRNRVVYTYNLTVPPGLFTLIAAKLIGAKAVVSLCDIDVPGHTVPNQLGWRLNFLVQRKLIPLFDGHVVAADAIARDFLPGRCYLRLDGGMSSEFLATLNETERTHASDDTHFAIGFAGRVDETNGIPTLLKAFSLLEERHFRLFIAGTGPLEEQVKKAAQNDPRINFWGFCSVSEVIKLYAASDVLVNMRITQQRKTEYFFPSKLLEYLASGVPVITTCTGHAEAEFGEFVYLLRDETAEDLAALIRKVAGLNAKVRSDTGKRAQEFMVLRKTWGAQAKRVAEFIRNVVLEGDRLGGQAQNPVPERR